MKKYEMYGCDNSVQDAFRYTFAAPTISNRLFCALMSFSTRTFLAFVGHVWHVFYHALMSAGTKEKRVINIFQVMTSSDVLPEQPQGENAADEGITCKNGPEAPPQTMGKVDRERTEDKER